MSGSREPTSARLILTLGLAGLISGLALVGVFILTEPRILRNRAEALERAIFRVLPGTETVQMLVARDEDLTAFEGTEGQLPAEPAVFAGFDEAGALVGYAVPAEGAGFQDTIKLIYGFDATRRVIVGMQVLDSRETPGLGDKIITDAEFLENFRALEVDPTIVAVRHGRKQRDNEVDCITGATISSEAVVSILNESSTHWIPLLEKDRSPGGKGSDAATSP